MKKLLYKYGILLLVLVSGPAMAGVIEGDITKEKTVSKTYNVNSDAGIDIRNKYGNIYVTTWNEDKISIEVVIKVSGRNEEAVNKRINSINIELNALVTKVSATTVIGESSGRNNINMQINYTVRIPKKGGVELDNKYGNITIDKIMGKSDIDCKYGAVNIAELNGESNTVRIDYCDNSSIGYVKNGSFNARYSGLAIAKCGNLLLDSNYTNVNVKEAGNVKYNSNYGDITVGSAANIEGSGNYLVLKFGTLSGNLEVTTTYSSIVVGHVAAKANNIVISSAYTNIDLQYDADYAFNFEVNLKYSGLQASGLTYQSKKESGSSGYYKGFYKSENSNKVNIGASYGNVKLTRE